MKKHIALVVLVLFCSILPIPGAEASSAYRGKYYDYRYEKVRQCIVHRESRGRYHIVNRYSGAGGAYQFLPSTARNVARMMGNPNLAYTRPHYWSKYHQDKAFWTLWNHGRGRSHWYSRSKPCW